MDVVNRLTAGPSADRRPQLLVVEDEIVIRAFVSEMLRDAGYDVVEAFNGDEAVDILKAGIPIDLVISDVRMPGSTDGLALLSFVQENLSNVPVILTSGHLETDIALAEGAVQFLAKPFKLDDALKIVGLEVAKLK